jgi:hypothetical protein
MKLFAIAVGALILGGSSPCSWGQVPTGPIPGIEAGQMVTIHKNGGEVLKGKVVRAESGSVVVDGGKKGGMVQVPNSDILKIGRKSRLQAAAIGSVIGFGGGAAIGGGRAEDLDMTTGAAVLTIGVAWGGIGAGLGAAIGHNRTVYRRP